MNKFNLFVKKRGITRLCHFTRTSNLPIIFGIDNIGSIPNGIISRQSVDDLDLFSSIEQPINYTDLDRWDGRKDLISTSIEVPNGHYLNTVIGREINNIFSDFCIILINPYIINEKTIFCPGNAAIERYRFILKNNDNQFKGMKAFEYLFSDVNNPKHGLIKRKNDLPNNYTTDEQAEVMIPNSIPVEYIDGVVFKNQETAIMERDKLQLCNVIDISHKKFYYSQNMFAKERNLNVVLETI